MTPDELPADMEGRIDGFVQRWEARMGTGAQTGDTIYCVSVRGFDGMAELRASDLRALLKAYQEQRRALEPFAKAATLFDTGDYVNHDACLYRPAAGDEYSLNSGHLLAARAALNQKGDER
jgi:hypothetical protein